MYSSKWIYCVGRKKSVIVPIRLGRMTISATFFVLDAVHISVIIGDDLLDLLRAQIDFKTKQFLHEGGVFSDVQWLNTASM